MKRGENHVTGKPATEGVGSIPQTVGGSLQLAVTNRITSRFASLLMMKKCKEEDAVNLAPPMLGVVGKTVGGSHFPHAERAQSGLQESPTIFFGGLEPFPPLSSPGFNPFWRFFNLTPALKPPVEDNGRMLPYAGECMGFTGGKTPICRSERRLTGLEAIKYGARTEDLLI